MTTAITTPAPSTTRPAADDLVLRRVLLVDAAVTGANGVAYLAGASLLDGVLGVSVGALRPIGAFLVAFAAVVAVVATRRPVPGGAVRELALANAAWVGASLVVAATDALDANGVGTAWTVLQAVTVAGFAALQVWALRRR
ncbi:hypothetical protein [Iamia sp. SCSIO 61187]|uniref:hypothetical protein n=1 Tax=Iamia sp. SCSIO 61187 TaxID=2722752 RepID=UPI001C6320AC|nr:hypothetical protein [Iamia sp. SCSIO 61187]